MLFGRHVNRYYLKYSWMFIIGILALIAVDYIQLLIPRYLGEVVEILQADGEINTNRIITLGLYVLMVAGGMFLGRFLWRVTLFNAAFRIEADMRHKMFLKAEALPRQYYHDNKVGSIMSWFTNDLETVSDYFGWGTVMIIDSLFLSVITIIQMVMLDFVMSIICFIPIVLIIIWGAITEKFMAIKWEERQKAYDELYDFSQENFTGIRVIKAFVKETKEIHAFAKVARKNADVNISFAKLSVIFDVVIEIIIALMLAIVLIFGGWFVYAFNHDSAITIFGYTEKITASKLVTFIGYMDILIWPMIALGQVVPMRSRSKASLKRISAFLDSKIDVRNPLNAIKLEDVKGNISYRNFSFKYPTYDAINLKNINLEI